MLVGKMIMEMKVLKVGNQGEDQMSWMKQLK